MNRAAAVIFSEISSDYRPRREAEALIDAGMPVDMICLRGNDQLPKEKVNGINVFRINFQKNRRGKFYYIWQYGYFFLSAFFKLSLLHLRKPYQIVHIHNMPEVLVFSALLPRLTGAKIILDLHDPMPEIFMTKYSVDESHALIRLLKFFEKISIRFADLVITPNKAFRDLFISRGCPETKIHIVMNCPQEKIFNKSSAESRLPEPRDKDKFEVMFHGYIIEHNGLDVAVEAVALIREKIPGIKFHIYGVGEFLNEVLELIKVLDIQDAIEVHGLVTTERIAEAIGAVDLGIVPNKLTPFTQLNFPTRIFEYLGMGKPVIAPRTQGVLDYFDEESLCLFEPGNANDLADKILDVYLNPIHHNELIRRANKVYEKNRWEFQRKHLIFLVKSLLNKSSAKELSVYK